MIKFEQVEKRYGHQTILKDISLQIHAGQKVVLIGPSGSGKSTLLRCINRLEMIQEGTLTVLGYDLSHPKAPLQALRKDVGMVFQSFNLFPHLSVLENVVLAPMKVRGESRQEAERHGMELLEKVGIPDKATAYPNQLSGGQQQRVAIARCLAMRPKIMLFDEPTSALDPEMVQEVLNVMTDLAHEEMTMVIVTHEMQFAKDVANRLLFMDAGQIVEDSPPIQFFSNPQTERARTFLQSARIAVG